MAIRISVGYPPDLESPIAEFVIPNDDGTISTPAVVYREDGKLVIEIYSKAGAADWKLALSDFVQAIGDAMTRLGA
jgi:hypothetical protein